MTSWLGMPTLMHACTGVPVTENARASKSNALAGQVALALVPPSNACGSAPPLNGCRHEVSKARQRACARRVSRPCSCRARRSDQTDCGARHGMDEEASAAVGDVGLPRLEQHVPAVAVMGEPDASVEALDPRPRSSSQHGSHAAGVTRSTRPAETRMQREGAASAPADA